MTGWIPSHPAHARNCPSRFFRERRHRSPCNGRKDSGHAPDHVRAVAFPCAAFPEVCLSDKNAVRHDHTLARVRKRAPYAEPSVSIRICCLACRRQPDSLTLLDLSASDLRLSLSCNTRVPATAHAILTGVDHDNTPEQTPAHRGSVFTHCIHLNSVPDPGTSSAAKPQRQNQTRCTSAAPRRACSHRRTRVPSPIVAPARMHPSPRPGAHVSACRERSWRALPPPSRYRVKSLAQNRLVDITETVSDVSALPSARSLRISCPRPARSIYIAPARMNPSSHPGAHALIVAPGRACSHHCAHAPGLLFRRQPLRALYRPGSPFALAIAPASSPHSPSLRQPLRTRHRSGIFSRKIFRCVCA